ncbi:CRISPR-associated endoribonuclease Cas6 [Thermovibrio sp.]
MRLKVSIRTKKVPILYRHRVISLFKEALKISDEEYKDFLYAENSPKPFTFNLHFPKGYRIEREPLLIDEEFTLENVETFYISESQSLTLYISSPDYRFLVSLYNGLLKLREFDFSSDKTMITGGEKLSWRVEKIVPLRGRPVLKSKVIVKTCSPLLLEESREKVKKPVLFDEERFNEVFNEVSDKKLKTLRGEGLKKRVFIRVLSAERVVVKHTLDGFRKLTGKPYMFLTASKGIFELSGDIEDLNYLVEMGLGSRTGQGFGMVEVVG